MIAKVTIVIPTLNRADKLPRAIESALVQTVPCEIIVVDHGSTDHTSEVANQYNSRITYLRRERDFGPHFCWLEGVLYSTGDFVHLQFDDDWIEDNFIEACMQVMDEETGFSFSVARLLTEGDSESNQLLFDQWLPDTGVYPAFRIEKKLIRNVVSPGCCLFRRQILLDSLYQGQLPLPLGKYHGVGPDQFASLLSILRYPKVGFVKEPLSVFMAHPGSITIDAASDIKKKAELKKAYKDVARFYKELKAIRLYRKIFGVR